MPPPETLRPILFQTVLDRSPASCASASFKFLGCWAASLLWIWPRVPCADVAHSGALRPSPRHRSARASCGMASERPSHLLLHLPVCAKRYALSTKPTTRGVGSSAPCAQRRGLAPRCACAIPLQAPLPHRPSRDPRAREPWRRAGERLRRCMSRPRFAPRGALGAREAGCARGGCQRGALGGRAAGGGVKRAFVLPSMLPLLSSPRRMFFSLHFVGRFVTWPRLVWRLPMALGPIASNDLLSVRALNARHPMLSASFDESGKACRRRPPLSDGVFIKCPEASRAASTSPKAEG